MKPNTVAVDVAAHPFLIGMSEHQMKLMTDCAMTSQFETGEIIFRAGEKADRFYLIEEGEVALESTLDGGAAVVIDTVRSGDLLGWSWLFPPYVWQFTARVVQPTTALIFYGTMLRQYCDRDHSLGYQLFKRMSEVMTRRLQAARTRLLKG